MSRSQRKWNALHEWNSMSIHGKYFGLNGFRPMGTSEQREFSWSIQCHFLDEKQNKENQIKFFFGHTGAPIEIRRSFYLHSSVKSG